ncbi:hypothetical protein [Rhodococcus sp. IEGM 1379]|nr:hypothetical protein [Rhodococcus sp. IEGM 1379]MDI9918277.1 hypothetical protein [Rhodococcus sp. IEGM 1379]
MLMVQNEKDTVTTLSVDLAVLAFADPEAGTLRRLSPDERAALAAWTTAD